MRALSLRSIVITGIVCGWLLAGGHAAAAQRSADVDHEAALAAFNARVQVYVWDRARLEEPLPPFDERRHPGSLMLSRRYLASAIRVARSRARAGVIFGPPVDALFRDLLGGAIAAGTPGNVRWSEGGAEACYVDLIVHEPVPEWAMQTLPAPLVQALPPLPPAIEYRLVEPYLILWDAHAEILIDALPGLFLERREAR